MASLHDPHEFTLRVRYEETDRMGVVYHGKYFEYFEVGRTEWLRARGLTYRKIEESGVGLVVVEVGARYKAPAHYDDMLTVRTTLTEIGRASVSFSYEVVREGEVLVEGETKLVSVRGGKVARLPPELMALREAAPPAT
jgi:acyl-CoA thioester hydrolase